jgi:hypothetical protein
VEHLTVVAHLDVFLGEQQRELEGFVVVRCVGTSAGVVVERLAHVRRATSRRSRASASEPATKLNPAGGPPLNGPFGAAVARDQFAKHGQPRTRTTARARRRALAGVAHWRHGSNRVSFREACGPSAFPMTTTPRRCTRAPRTPSVRHTASPAPTAPPESSCMTAIAGSAATLSSSLRPRRRGPSRGALRRHAARLLAFPLRRAVATSLDHLGAPPQSTQV